MSMKTIAVSLCYLGEPGRILRNNKWLDFMAPLREALGIDEILLLSNADPLPLLSALDVTVFDERGALLQEGGREHVSCVLLEGFLPRLSQHQYPYIYRALSYVQHMLRTQDIDRVIFLDTDLYILTPRFAQQIRDIKSGFVTFYSKKYGFPETTLMVLAQDAFERFLSFPIPTYHYYNDAPLEELFRLRFTEIRRAGYLGDRYGETCEPQTPDMDYYAQHRPGCPEMVFHYAKSVFSF